MSDKHDYPSGKSYLVKVTRTETNSSDVNCDEEGEECAPSATHTAETFGGQAETKD